MLLTRNARLSRWPALLTVASFLAGISVPELAEALVVNRCGTDVADVQGGGTNLEQALAAGGIVSFACGSAATITVTKEHSITIPTYIEGNNAITLDGTNSITMMSVHVPNVSIRVANLIVKRAGPPDWGPGIPLVNLSGFIQGREDTSVTITHVRFLDSNRPLYAGQLVIADTVFDDNRGTAVFGHDMTLSNVRIRGNTGQAIGSLGGTVSIFDSQVSSSGASSFDNCNLRIERTEFSSTFNTSSGHPGGALTTGCDTQISNSRFYNNKSDGSGGAISITKKVHTVSIRGSQFESNSAAESGGAIDVADIANAPRKITIEWSVFRRNRARFGGAISLGQAFENNDLIETRGVHFSDNEATSEGGAIGGTNVTLRASRSTFLRNRGAAGAAIWLHQRADRRSIITNSLFVLNKAAGGVIQGSNARIINSTIVGSEGFGLVSFPTSGTPVDRGFRLSNSIVENSTEGNCQLGGLPLVDEGQNLQFPGNSCGGTIPVAVSALDTFYAPLPGGAAHEAGNMAICISPEVGGLDLYGERRPQTSRCSIGAIEGDLMRIARGRRLRREPVHIPDVP